MLRSSDGCISISPGAGSLTSSSEYLEAEVLELHLGRLLFCPGAKLHVGGYETDRRSGGGEKRPLGDCMVQHN